jgi:hypothetical protein
LSCFGFQNFEKVTQSVRGFQYQNTSNELLNEKILTKLHCHTSESDSVLVAKVALITFGSIMLENKTRALLMLGAIHTMVNSKEGTREKCMTSR